MEVSRKEFAARVGGSWGEECGLVGIYAPQNSDDIASFSYLALYSLQHRGQESAGICVNNGGEFDIKRGMGLVNNVFEEKDLRGMSGNIGIGHVRYSTSGANRMVNVQPFVTRCIKGNLALAHNGDLVNHGELKKNLEERGAIFHSGLDTEIIAHLIARSLQDDIKSAFLESLQRIKGAFSILAMTDDSLLAARDPHGFRPLVLGKKDEYYIVASESCAFDIMEAEPIREIEPGELVTINEEGIQSQYYREKRDNKFCVFEFIYFARPDSVIKGQNVRQARKKMGLNLSREAEINGDVVVPVPSSGFSAALGFSEGSGIPYKQGILQNKYVGRTFIQPRQEIRNLKVRIKLNPIKNIVRNNRVILVDDSIVRGTTSRQIISMLREAGAEEIHMAISSPPVSHSCYYGMDTSRRQQLIASRNNTEEICEHIGADSLTYLSREGLLDSLDAEDMGFCTACFDGNYPLEPEKFKQKV